MPVAKSLIAGLIALLIIGTGVGAASAQPRTSVSAQTSGGSTFDGTYKLSATNTDPNDCGTGTDADMEGNTLVLSGTKATITNQYGTYSGTFNESASTITFPNVTNSVQTLSVTAIMTLSNVSGGIGRIAGTANVSGEDAGGTGFGLLCNLPFTGVKSGSRSPSPRGGTATKKPKKQTTTTTKPKRKPRAASVFDGTYALIGTIPGAPTACSQADLNGTTLTLRGASATIKSQQESLPGTVTVAGQSKNQTFTITIHHYLNPNETLTIRGAGGGSALNPVLNTGDIAGTSNVRGVPGAAKCSNAFSGAPGTPASSTPTSSTPAPRPNLSDCSLTSLSQAMLDGNGVEPADPMYANVQLEGTPTCVDGYAAVHGTHNGTPLIVVFMPTQGVGETNPWSVMGSNSPGEPLSPDLQSACMSPGSIPAALQAQACTPQ